MGSTYYFCTEEGWYAESVRGLPFSKLSYYQEQVPLAEDQ
jgi:hypothetical protein